MTSRVDGHDRLARHVDAICQLLLRDVLQQAVAAYRVSNLVLTGHDKSEQFALYLCIQSCKLYYLYENGARSLCRIDGH